jgi:hypothetical protein
MITHLNSGSSRPVGEFRAAAENRKCGSLGRDVLQQLVVVSARESNDDEHRASLRPIWRLCTLSFDVGVGSAKYQT